MREIIMMEERYCTVLSKNVIIEKKITAEGKEEYDCLYRNVCRKNPCENKLFHEGLINTVT